MTDKKRSAPSIYPTQFVVGVVFISLGPLLDPILRDLDIPLAQGGLLSVGFFLGTEVSLIVLNSLLAGVSVKRAMVGGALVQALGFAIGGLAARGLGSLFTALFVAGVGCSILNTLPGMWVSSHVKTRTARAMLLMLIFFASGVMVTPLLMGLLLNAGASWRWIMEGIAALSLALALVITGMPLSDIPGRQNIDISHLRRVVGFNARLLAAILAAAVLYVGAEFMFNVWLAKFEIDVFGAGATSASVTVTLFWVGAVTGRMAAVVLTRRFSPGHLLAGCGGMMAAFSVCFALSPNQPVSQVFAFAAGLGASASYPLICSFSGRFPTWHSGVVFSAMVFAAGVGSMVFPYMVGPVADALGFRLAIALAAVPAILVSFTGLILHRVGEDRAAVAPAASIEPGG